MHTFIILVLTVLSATSGITAKVDKNRGEAHPNYQLSRLENFMRNYRDFMGLEDLGFQAVSETNECLIRAIMHDLDMDDYCIEIRGMSNYAQHTKGRLNAFIKPGSWFNKKAHSYLFISEEWFDTLSEDEQQSLLRHELMHLKHNHVSRSIKIALISGLALYCLNKIIQKALPALPTVVPQEGADQSETLLADKFARVRSFCGMSLFLSWQLVGNAYSRAFEKEADIEAAKTMQTKQGFIDLFNQMKDNSEDPESKFKIKRWLTNLLKPLEKMMSSHPSFDERIAYIENL